MNSHWPWTSSSSTIGTKTRPHQHHVAASWLYWRWLNGHRSKLETMLSSYTACMWLSTSHCKNMDTTVIVVHWVPTSLAGVEVRGSIVPTAVRARRPGPQWELTPGQSHSFMVDLETRSFCVFCISLYVFIVDRVNIVFVLCVWFLCCQYQCKWLPGKTRLW